MAMHDKYFPGSTVSRDLPPGEHSWDQDVYQSGKPVLDSELNLGQDIRDYTRRLLGHQETHSGWFRGQTFAEGYDDFQFPAVGDPDFLVDAFQMVKKVAKVAGMPVVVEFTNTATDYLNVIQLQTPRTFDGSPDSIKRTDFVFLEVWRAQVTPTLPAQGTFTIDTSVTALSPGDSVTIDCTFLVPPGPLVVLVEGVDWVIGGNDNLTAINIANAINASVPLNPYVTAQAIGPTVVVSSLVPGGAGNAILFFGTTALGPPDPITPALATPFAGGLDGTNVPAAGKIYRHGNVDSDSTTWLNDDLVDPIVLAETTQRVQIQYRIRVTGTSEAVNFKHHPDGFSSPRTAPGATGQINAQGSQSGPVDFYPFVPADLLSTRDNSSAVLFDIADSGLWVSGDGTQGSATALGSVDGFVYAIPIGFMFRRNQSEGAGLGFDPWNNTNGAPSTAHAPYNGAFGKLIPALSSDRPDDNFSDALVNNDFMDLRRSIAPQGQDLKAELQFQMQSLLDGNYRTWAVDTASKQTMGGGSGDVSTRYLICNEIGREQGKGGNPPWSGDTGRGVTIRSFDHVSRRFADQPVVERLCMAFYPGDRQAASVAPGQDNDGKYVIKTGLAADRWAEGDELHFTLDDFNATSEGGVWAGRAWLPSWGVGNPSIEQFAPPGTVITDVLSVWHDDGNFDTPIATQETMPTTVLGLGTTHLIITLDANPSSVNGGITGAPAYQMIEDGTPGDGSPRRIFVEVEVTYPIGYGLTDTPDLEVVPDPLVYDGAGGAGLGPMLAGSPAFQPTDMQVPLYPTFREGFREVGMEYIAGTGAGGVNPIDEAANPVTLDGIVSRADTDLYMPRRMYRSGSHNLTISDIGGGSGAYAASDILSEYGSSTRKLVLTAALPSTQSLCEVTYYAQDPIPNFSGSGEGYQLAVYFRSNAPQTAGVFEGVIYDTGVPGGGLLPKELQVEPLLMDDGLWTGQVGMGSTDSSFPYVAPLDQVAVNDGDPSTHPEWYFAATASVSIDDFDAETGLLNLHPFVPAARTEDMTFGGPAVGELPRKDVEFRAYYPFVNDETYRPTVMSQPLSGVTRHKVFTPMLVRAIEQAQGHDGGILWRKNEVLLVVFSRFAELDEENNVRFTETDNTTAAAVYRTKNLLLVMGE